MTPTVAWRFLLFCALPIRSRNQDLAVIHSFIVPSWAPASGLQGRCSGCPISTRERFITRTVRPIFLPILVTVFLIASISAAAFAADAQTSAPAGVVNINTADAAQLSLLPRVGLKAAQRIVDYRTQHGPFQKTTDIMQVKGFGG